MNKNEAIELLNRCPCDSELYNAAQVALKKLRSSTTVKVVVGEPQESSGLLKVYADRLKQKRERGQRIEGLAATVENFAKCQGALVGGYAQTESGLIYFWRNEAGELIGCIVQAEGARGVDSTKTP